MVFLEAIVTGNQGAMLLTANQNRSAERLLYGSIKEQDITKLQNPRFFIFVLWSQNLGLKLKLIFFLIVIVVYLYSSITGRVTLTRTRPKNVKTVPLCDLCTKSVLQS